jgi:hypothetical protein
MEDKCLFEAREKSGCGNFELSRLSECQNDISGHLSACHLSQMIGLVRECDLILNRAGIFDVSPSQVGNLWICEKHRGSMGRKWRPPKTCQYPLHSGPKKKLKNRNVVNADTNQEVRMLLGKNVAIGSRMFFNIYL